MIIYNHNHEEPIGFAMLFWKHFEVLLKTRIFWYQNTKSVLTRYKQFSFQFILTKSNCGGCMHVVIKIICNKNSL